jgi:hypothetical protein
MYQSINVHEILEMLSKMHMVIMSLMHVKCIHILCILLSLIPTYLYVIRCYIHVCIDLWGFSINPDYLVYNSAEQETHVLYIFNFHEPSRTKIELEFFWRDYFSRNKNKRRISTWVGQQGPNEYCWRGPILGRATWSLFHLDALISSILISDWRGWPKNPYI